MARLLHSISAFCFYLLGSTFFLAYVLQRNVIAGDWPVYWMQVADLPFLLAGLTYGGISLSLSFGEHHKAARIIGWCLAIPLGIVFLSLLFLAFRKALPL